MDGTGGGSREWAPQDDRAAPASAGPGPAAFGSAPVPSLPAPVPSLPLPSAQAVSMPAPLPARDPSVQPATDPFPTVARFDGRYPPAVPGYPGGAPGAVGSAAVVASAPPPARLPHRWGLGAYVVVEAVFLLVSVGLGFALGRPPTHSAGAIALALSIPTLCAAGLAMLITRLRGNGPVVDLGLRVEGRDVWVGLGCGLAGLVVTIPASILYATIVGKDATSAVGEVLGGVRADPVTAVVILLIVVFVAPLCEEIVYRGLLWGAVERLGAHRYWALGITTIIFALAHFEFERTPLLLVVAIPIGVARVITGRLPAGVIAHQINNLLPGVALMLGLLGAVPMT